MKSIRLMLIIVLVFAAFIAGAIAWWKYPTPITDIAPYEVSKIHITEYNEGGAQHGGTRIIVTDQMNIKHIIENLNSVSIKKRESFTR